MVKEKKKILYWGPYAGHVGTIKAQINSAYAMSHYGAHDVFLVRAHSEFKGMEEELSQKGLRIESLGLDRYFPGLEKSTLLARRPYMFMAAFIGFIPLIRLIRRERPDVIVLNLLVVPAMIAIRLSGVSTKIVVSVQGYPHFLGIEGVTPPLWKRLENSVRKRLWNSIFPKADLVLTMTEETRSKLFMNTSLRENQLHTLKNPVIEENIIERSGETLEHPWYVDDKVRVIVGMGRLSYQKGFDLLIEAFSLVREMGLDVRLVIVGEGEDREYLEKLALDLAVSKYIDLVGHKDNPFPYIVGADLFVLSSRWEDPGHAIIEAAALKVPIVTADCPSGPGYLVSQGAGGWLCQAEDANDMAIKIKEALENPDPEKVSLAKINASTYSIFAHFDSFEKLLNEQ